MNLNGIEVGIEFVGTWGSGTGVPTINEGQVGFFYLNTATLDLYKKIAEDHWERVANIMGYKGDTGQSTKWWDGAGVPSNNVGKDGDFYIQLGPTTSTSLQGMGDLYKKTKGTWLRIGSIKEPTMQRYATNEGYIHPKTHPATMIEQDPEHRFVSDADIAFWSNKSDFSGSYTDLRDIPTDLVHLEDLEDAIEGIAGQIIPQEHTHDASQISYSTPNDPSIKTVKDALDKLLYYDLTITLSCSTSTSQLIGSTLQSVKFTWTYNKGVFSQSFNNEPLNTGIREYQYTTPFSSNKTFTLKANDGTKDYSRSITISFVNNLYYGAGAGEVSSIEELIRSLSSKLSSSRANTFTAYAGEDMFVYFASPSRLGDCTFYVGGFEGGFNFVTTTSITNKAGYTENYYVYKSSQPNLGSLDVQVK